MTKLVDVVTNIKGQHRNGRTIILPIIGLTTVPENGILSLEEDQAIRLVDSQCGFSLLLVEPEEIKPQTITPEKLETEEEVEIIKPQTTKPEKISEPTIRETLEELKVEDLQELAKPFPKKEWSNLTKQPLIEYLEKKLQEDK